MKKIGILFGKEDTFPQAFIDRVNSKGIKDITAEAVSIDMVQQAAPTDYAVIIDRISQDVPFYRAYLKNAAISGTCVINNPFWWSADEKFFNNALAEKIGVAVPKTVILPSHERPDDTGEKSFRNLKFPYGWEKNFEYVGWPAYMKPHDGGGWKNVYKVENPEDLWAKHAETGQLVMLLQEEIQFTEYFRCYVLGGDRVHIMQYEPRNPHHERYVLNGAPVDQKILDEVREGCIKLNKALGYDFNTVEFAIRDGVPYAIDFCNPAPDADVHSVGEDNFEWIVENAANLAIEKAKKYKQGVMNLTWGSFVTDQITSAPKPRAARKAPVRKTTAAKASTRKTAAKKTTTAKSADGGTATPAARATKKTAVTKATTRRSTKAETTKKEAATGTIKKTRKAAVAKTPTKRAPKATASKNSGAIAKAPAKAPRKVANKVANTKTTEVDQTAPKAKPAAKKTTTRKPSTAKSKTTARKGTTTKPKK